MNKRLLCAILSALITFTGCGAALAVEDIWAPYDPPITITTVKHLNDNFTTHPLKPDDWNAGNNPWIWQYRDELGINVEVLWEVPDANEQYIEKLSVAISSNQLPDIFRVNTRQLATVVRNGQVQPITDVYEEYISPWARQYTDDGGMGLKQATFGGELMAIPVTQGNIDHAALLWMRKDWLDVLGLTAPQTLDELEEIARAFTEDDPDGNGENDTFGLAITNRFVDSNMGINPLIDGFGTLYGQWLKTDEGLIWGGIQPEVKDGLNMVARMFAKGYIDPEFITKDMSKVSEDLVAGKIGMFFGQHWLAFWPLGDAQAANPEVNWEAFPIPTLDGSPARVQVGTSASEFFVVNQSCQYPEAAIKMLNMGLKYQPDPSPDHKAIFHFGTVDPENEKRPLPNGDMQLWALAVVYSFSPTQNIDIFRDHKLLAEGGSLEQTIRNQRMSDEEIEILKERWSTILESRYIPAEGRQLDYVDYYGARHNTPDDTLFGRSFYGVALWIYPYGSFWTVDQYMNNGQLIFPEFYGANTATMTSNGATLDQMRDEIFTKIIVGQIPIDEFDSYVDSWKNMGGNSITQEVNDWYKEVVGG